VSMIAAKGGEARARPCLVCDWNREKGGKGGSPRRDPTGGGGGVWLVTKKDVFGGRRRLERQGHWKEKGKAI